MTLLVEDGSKVPGAESYITAAECTAYHVRRGNTVWGDMSSQEMEEAIIRAMDFMRGRYRNRWKGHVASYTQGQDWPRIGVRISERTIGMLANYVPENVVPVDVKNALAELSFRAAQGPLLEDETRQPIRETVGPITVEYEPFQSPKVTYAQVDEMLNIYLSGGSNGANMKLVRV